MCKFQKFNNTIARQLNMILYSPDMSVFTQGELEDETEFGLYFIMQGYCQAEIQTSKCIYSNEFPLVKGEHFGEISCLFDCKRTATITSKSYNIIGMLNHKKFSYLMIDYPEYKRELLCHVYKYSDPYKTMFKTAFLKMIYFNPKMIIPTGLKDEQN